MAEQINVSPGIYTSEVDLTFAAQSIGVSSLGIVGEAQQGPAFEPILIKNYDEYIKYFGGASTEKFSGTQIVKYEGNYIAKEYLKEASQLYMTRVLGLSGYNAGGAWSVSTIAQPDISTLSLSTSNNIYVPFVYTTSNGSLTYNYPSFLTPYQNVISSSTNTYLTSVVSLFASTSASTSTISYKYGSLTAINESTITGITSTSMTDVLGVSSSNNTWWNTLFAEITNGNYSGITYGIYTTGLTRNGTASYSGTTCFTYQNGSVLAYTGWNNTIVATLRSDANWSVANETLSFVVSGNPSMVMVDNISQNSKGTFKITGVTSTNTPFSYNVSMDNTKKEYLPKVLGSKPKEKSTNLFVEEIYSNLLEYGFQKGYIRGLRTSLLSTPNSFSDYKQQWSTPATPYFVSELRGTDVFRLFRVITISDGSGANTLIKTSIQNINLDRKEFDLVVRDFNDTDSNPIILEKYVRCSMDDTQLTFIGKKVGTSDGKYDLKSKYIMIDVASDAPSTAVPAGFEGYTIRSYGTGYNSPKIQYKTKYFTAGEQITNPPVGTSAAISSGDSIRKCFLGLSNSNFWGIDSDIFKYKGNVTSTIKVNGFHMDSGATIVNIGGVSTTFDTGVAPFQSEAGTIGTPYELAISRKFTAAPYGGFDGWDIYRSYRTNGDSYRLGQTKYTSANPSFNAIGNSDYYAYLQGIQTFSNPEASDINVLVTPGIDIESNSALVEYAIDMVETERADSIYIPTLPDINMFSTDASNTDNWKSSQDVVDLIDQVGIDSNYTAVYYPFVLYNDTENNSKLWIPPTAEVVRNLALTDNTTHEWYAIAGIERGLVNSKPRTKLSQNDRDLLYPGRINPIATFRGVGPVIWGNRNLQIKDSNLDRLSIRRLLLQTRKLISAVGLRLLFQPNDQQVRNDFLNLVNPILDGIRRERGLSDFRVKLSNSPEDLDNNQLNGLIYLKTTSSLEFINVQFVITPQGASFENV
jgi:Phage tail sheath protein subtilisin-like domain